jgi:hypothetical protein
MVVLPVASLLAGLFLQTRCYRLILGCRIALGQRMSGSAREKMTQAGWNKSRADRSPPLAPWHKVTFSSHVACSILGPAKRRKS